MDLLENMNPKEIRAFYEDTIDHRVRCDDTCTFFHMCPLRISSRNARKCRAQTLDPEETMRLINLFFMGDKGTLRLNDHGLEHFDFLTFKAKKVEMDVGDGTTNSGHGGGDDGVVSAFLEAVRSGDPAAVKTGPDVSLESHLIVFAAERARRHNRVEPVPAVRDLA